MKSADSYDIVIAGGGIAGLSSGVLLARRGLSVLICEKERLPADKVCGEGIMPAGVELLGRLGVRIPSENSHPITGVRFIVGDVSAAAVFREGPGLGVRRTELSNLLTEAARSTPGIEIREKCSVLDLPNAEGEVETSGGIVAARLLICADGMKSSLRQKAGFASPGRRYSRFAVRRHFRIGPDLSRDGFVEVHSAEGIEAYITPVSENEIGVALLWDTERIRPEVAGEQLFRSLLKRFPVLERRFLPEGQTDQPAATGPLEQNTTGVAGENFVLLGDSGGYVDAITGEGISLALAQSFTLCDCLTRWISGSRSLKRCLSDFSSERKRLTFNYRLTTRSLLFLTGHPTLARVAARFLSNHPHALEALLSFNMGTITVPRFLIRFIRALL